MRDILMLSKSWGMKTAVSLVAFSFCSSMAATRATYISSDDTGSVAATICGAGGEPSYGDIENKLSIRLPGRACGSVSVVRMG